MFLRAQPGYQRVRHLFVPCNIVPRRHHYATTSNSTSTAMAGAITTWHPGHDAHRWVKIDTHSTHVPENDGVAAVSQAVTMKDHCADNTFRQLCTFLLLAASARASTCVHFLQHALGESDRSPCDGTPLQKAECIIPLPRKQIRTISALIAFNSSNFNRIWSSRELIFLSDSNFWCVWGSCAVCCGLFSHEDRHTARTQHSTGRHSTGRHKSFIFKCGCVLDDS